MNTTWKLKLVSSTVGHNEFGIFLSPHYMKTITQQKRLWSQQNQQLGQWLRWCLSFRCRWIRGRILQVFTMPAEYCVHAPMVEMVWLQSNVVLAICIDTGTVGLPPANHTRSAVDHKSFQSQALPGCWRELSERRTCEATRCLSLCWTSVSATSASSLPLCLYALILAVYFSAGHDYAVLCSVTLLLHSVTVR